ncbi:MAG TPA: hypothetical protein V6C91_11795 [Coleofasciculaceae cyanobacterium]
MTATPDSDCCFSNTKGGQVYATHEKRSRKAQYRKAIALIWRRNSSYN